MRFAVVLILGCVLVSSAAQGAQVTVSVTSPSIQSAIVSTIESDRNKYGGHAPVPGVLVGVWDGKGGSFVRAFGYANLAKKRPLTPADHFRIGSNTKMFVVSVILQLIAEKKLTLSDPVSRFRVGVNIPNGNNITVRELCNMRSGLFEAYDTPQFAKLNLTVPANFSPRMLVAWAVKQKPYFAPGKGYRYSNTNYVLLGLIIESIEKDSVGNQIRKRLLQPFGLTQTSYPRTQAMPQPWARGYALDKHANWEDVSGEIPVAFAGSAGEMISDMTDVKRWVKLYATAKTGVPANFRPDFECLPFLGNTSFGLGLTCSAGWYGYTGGLPGYNTADYYFPATGMTIIVWTTYYALNPPEGIASAMMRDVARIVSPSHVPFVYTKSQLKAIEM